jgi:hypothetical protein
MERIVIDDRLPERLAIRVKPVELVDASGRVVGVFTPTHKLPEGYDFDGPEPTLEELEAIADSAGPWYSTNEVIAHLRRLG